MDYKKLLKRARKNLPTSILKKERFVIPKVRGHIQGNRTVISNFYNISDILRRKPEHMLKYILKELATPGDMKKNAVIIGRKVSATRVNEKIIKYAQEFVLCKECGKPDTNMVKKEGFMFLKCTACGAQYPVKSKI